VIPKSAEFNFAEADWDQIEADWPRAFKALSYGATIQAAAARYDQLLAEPLKAATLWNIMTAMRDAHLPQGCPIDYLREIIWDGDLAPAQDRFFGFASFIR
jgi:hypothetical protein